MNHYTINLDEIKDIARLGIRRSVVFLGLGVNAARDEGFKKYQLTNISLFRFIPDQVEDIVLKDFKESFEKWIISNCLRELIETFALFLDKIYEICLLVEINEKEISKEDILKFQNEFEPFKRKGIEEKLKKLKNKFNIQTEREKYFHSIKQTRNCITHRSGIVAQEDLEGNPSFKLKWWGFDIFVEKHDGNKISITPSLLKGGIRIEVGETIKYTLKDKEKEYQLGDIITLTPDEIGEICLLVDMVTNDISNGTRQYAKKMGLVVI